MTMGTSIMRGSFSLTVHTPARVFRISEGEFEALRSRGLTIQKIEGLFVADSIPDSIQRSITCQTSADRIRRLICLPGQSFNFPVNFLVADLNVLLVGDLFQQQTRFYFLHSLLALAGPKTPEVELLHVLGAHALRSQRSQSAIQANIHLTVNQGFGNFEVIAADQFGKQLVFGVPLGFMAPVVFHAFANALPDFVDAIEFS